MIGVIAPYSQFKADVLEISKKFKIPVIIQVGGLQLGLKKAKEMIEKNHVKVIIARGATADLIKDKLEVPVVKIDITNFDIIKILSKAKEINSDVVLMDHFENQERLDLPLIERILNVKILLKQFYTEEDIRIHINEIAYKKEINIVIGTAECVASTAGSKGLHSFVIFSQLESITEALLRAKETLENFKKESFKQKHLESIISSAFHGVISTNSRGQITVFNEVASKILSIPSHEVIGRHITNIHFPFIKKLIGDGTSITRKIIKHGNQQLFVNRHHLYENGMVITFQEAENALQMDSSLRSKLYHRRFTAKYSFTDIIYQSSIVKKTIQLAKSYANSESNILIYGESGTGKELFAQSIHNESSKRLGPFVAINCAALPENLLESELFGYEDGAFTGAKKGGKPGLFEMAHEGTIFLDEIGEISPTMQSRLLRVLQEKEVMRIGGERIIPVNIRVISATNKDLIHSIQKQEFRSDLFYRLNILHIHLPSLRDRKEDIDPLVDHFLIKYGGSPEQISEQERKILKEYRWPGNVRELENVIERVVAICPFFKTSIKEILHPFEIRENFESSSENYVKVKIGKLEEMQNQIIDTLVEKYEGNKSDLANILGISRTTLWKKIKEVH